MTTKTVLSSFTGQILSVVVGLTVVSACTLDGKTHPEPSLSLKNTTWQLQTLDGNPVVSERPLTLNFDDNRLNGYAGCNSFFGTYVSGADGVFSSGAIGATKMACGGERDQHEQHYLNALSQAHQFVVSHDQLHLLDANRQLLMVFSTVKSSATPR